MVRETVNLVCERYAAFDQPPLTAHQIYRLRLRSQKAPHKEVACATADETAEAGAQSEAVETENREMQFALGDDDTDFENLMTRLKKKRSQQPKQRRAESKAEESDEDDNSGAAKGGEAEEEGDGARVAEDDDDDDVGDGDDSSKLLVASNSRLPDFVRNVAPVMEMLLDEARADRETTTAGASSAPPSDGSLFADKAWRPLGGGGKDDDAAAGSTGLASANKVVFSSVRVTMLVAIHADPSEAAGTRKNIIRGAKGEVAAPDEKEPRSEGDDVVRLSVWDSAAQGDDRPTALLCGGGPCSCACFAPCNGFVVCAGTEAGALSVWDLRERETADARRGTRSAASSTAPVGTVASSVAHTSRVAALAPLGGGEGGGDSASRAAPSGSAAFQLASLDDRGLVAIWLVVEREDGASSSLKAATASVVVDVATAGLNAADETYLGLRAGGLLRLQCSRTFLVWSGVPASLSPHGAMLLVTPPGVVTSSSSFSSSKRPLASNSASTSALYAGKAPARSLGAMVIGGDAAEDGAAANPGPRFDDFLAAVGVGPGCTSAFAASPADPNEFIAALSDGHVVRCSRLGAAKEPRVFYASAKAMRRDLSAKTAAAAATTTTAKPTPTPMPLPSAAETKGMDPADLLAPLPPAPDSSSRSRATAIHFSPFRPDAFLVGQQDGAFRLHRLDFAVPIRAWPACAAPESSGGAAAKKKGRRSSMFFSPPVADIKWSPDRPAVFFVLCANGDLHTFDLLQNEAAPVHSVALPLDLGGLTDRTAPASLALSCRRGAAARKAIAVTIGGTVFTRHLHDAATLPKPNELWTFAKFLDASLS